MRAAGVVAACLAGAVALRLTALDQPLDRDSGLYAAIGQRLSLHTLPYRDLFDHKQPLVHWVYAVLNLIAPRSLGAIRVAAAVPSALAAALVFAYLERMVGAARAIGAAVVVVVASASTVLQGTDLNTEHLLTAPAAAAVLGALMLERSERAWVPVAIGLLGGLAVLAKAIGGLIALSALIPLLAGRRLRGQSALTTVVAFGWALAAPTVAVLLVYTVLGGVDDLVFANLTYNSRYVGEQGLTLIPKGPAALQLLTAAALSAAIVRLVAHRGRDVTGWTLVAWLLMAWLGAQTSSRGFPHYYVPLVVPACTLLFLPVVAVERAFGWARLAALLLATLAVVLLGLPVAADTGRSGPEIAGRVYGSQELALWTSADAVGNVLRAHARDRGAGRDDLFVVGSEPEYYWRSGLPSANRWLFDYPAQVAPERFGPDVRDLCVRGPRFVVLATYRPPAYAARCRDHRRYRPILRRGVVVVLERRG